MKSKYKNISIVNVLNVYIHNLTTVELLENLNQFGGFVVTPNVDHIVKLQKDYEFIKAYHKADYRVCDSKILQYISKILGNPIQEKISGSDFFPAFYEYNKDNENIKIFLLGGLEGVAKIAQENINKKVGREIVVDVYSPPFGFEKDEKETEYILDRIDKSGATVLAVGLGAPKQEKWIAKYKNSFKNIKIFLAIGATIDFEAGNKPRSPKWISSIGLEWLFRLISEPSRLWKRYLIESLPIFGLIIQKKLNLYKIPAFVQLYSLPVGELLHQAGLITTEQIDKTLQEQKKEGQDYLFGEILEKWGWLKKKTVDFWLEQLPLLLEKHEQINVDECLKKSYLLTEEQFKEIAIKQSESGLNFSQIAVQEGWIKQKTLDWLLELANSKGQ